MKLHVHATQTRILVRDTTDKEIRVLERKQVIFREYTEKTQARLHILPYLLLFTFSVVLQWSQQVTSECKMIPLGVSGAGPSDIHGSEHWVDLDTQVYMLG